MSRRSVSTIVSEAFKRHLGADESAGTWIRGFTYKQAKYTFELKALSAAGMLSEKPAVATFEIKAAWWQTVAFRAAVIGVLIWAIWLFLRYRTRLLVRERARLEQAVRTRTLELEEQKLRAEEDGRSRQERLFD